MHFGRYQESLFEDGKALPQDWTEEFTKVLSHTYSDRATEDNCFFHVWGQIYDKEILVIISYLDHNDQMASPKTVFISHDLNEKEDKLKQTLENLVNFTGMIFDDIFATEDWNDYFSIWTENKFKDSKFFYKVTRENISLTLQAEQILSGKLSQQY